jgi:hypothetical protein
MNPPISDLIKIPNMYLPRLPPDDFVFYLGPAHKRLLDDSPAAGDTTRLTNDRGDIPEAR